MINVGKININPADNCRLVKAKYKTSENHEFHPFDTRCSDNYYTAISGYSCLTDCENMLKKETVTEIEKSLPMNLQVRFVFERMIMVRNGKVIWNNTSKTNSYLGFCIHTLYSEYVPSERTHGYTLTHSGINGYVPYIWEEFTPAFERAVEYSKKHPENFLLISGAVHDFNYDCFGEAVPPWAIAYTNPLRPGLVYFNGITARYRTEFFFNFFNTFTASEKDALIAKYPEPPEWKNWYTTEGFHKDSIINNLYVKHLLYCEENPYNSDNEEKQLREYLVYESDYLGAKKMFFRYCGIFKNMSADDMYEKYLYYNVPKCLEKKWYAELLDRLFKNMSSNTNLLQSVSTASHIASEYVDYSVLSRLDKFIADKSHLLDTYTLVRVCRSILSEIKAEKFGIKGEFKSLMLSIASAVNYFLEKPISYPAIIEKNQDWQGEKVFAENITAEMNGMLKKIYICLNSQH